MIDRDTALRRFEAFLDAMEAYEGANSDEARWKAEERALAARKALDHETGLTRLRRRRMATHARDLPAGAAPREADNFSQFIDACLDNLATPSARQSLRHALAAYFMDDEAILTERLARLLTQKALANAKGLLGALDSVESTSGVEPSAGLADLLRDKIVLQAGYTAGVEFGSSGRIPHNFWQRAARTHASFAERGRKGGDKVPGAKAETVRSWCQKENLSAKLFNNARRDGVAARDNPKSALMLLGTT